MDSRNSSAVYPAKSGPPLFEKPLLGRHRSQEKRGGERAILTSPSHIEGGFHWFPVAM